MNKAIKVLDNLNTLDEAYKTFFYNKRTQYGIDALDLVSYNIQKKSLQKIEDKIGKMSDAEIEEMDALDSKIKEIIRILE